MDSFLGLPLKLLVRLLVRWTLRSRTTEGPGSLYWVIWLNGVIILGHMTQWLSYQYPLRQNGLGKWLSHYATSNGGQVVRMLVRVISIVMVKITFSWLLAEASGFLAKNPGWESILLVTNPCFGTPGKDFTYIVRNWYILTNRVQQATFDSTEGLHT